MRKDRKGPRGGPRRAPSPGAPAKRSPAGERERPPRPSPSPRTRRPPPVRASHNRLRGSSRRSQRAQAPRRRAPNPARAPQTRLQRPQTPRVSIPPTGDDMQPSVPGAETVGFVTKPVGESMQPGAATLDRRVAWRVPRVLWLMRRAPRGRLGSRRGTHELRHSLCLQHQSEGRSEDFERGGRYLAARSCTLTLSSPPACKARLISASVAACASPPNCRTRWISASST